MAAVRIIKRPASGVLTQLDVAADSIQIAGLGIGVAPSGTDGLIKLAAASPGVLGEIGMDGTSGRPRAYINALNQQVQEFLTEQKAMLALPEARVTGNATRLAQVNFDGCSLFLRRSITFNRIVFRTTATTGGTIALLIYQLAGSTAGDGGGQGGATAASLVATVTAFTPAAGGNNAATPSEGTVTLQAGLIYVLFGRDSAANNTTFRTYTTQSVDLLTANIDTDTHPCAFTTTIAANTTPATFDPRTPTATSSDVVLPLWLKQI